MFVDLLQKLMRLFLCHLFSLPIFLVFVITILYKMKTKKSINGKKTAPPPSPPKLPVIGNLHQLGVLPHRTLQALSQIYGNGLMLLHFGCQPTLVVTSAYYAQQVMKNNDVLFSNRPNSHIASKFFYNATDMSFSPYGDYWRQIRSICVSQLLSTKKVQSLRVIREEETSLMVEKIKKSDGSVFNLREIIMLFTNDLICRASFGKKYSENNEGGGNFKKLLNDAMKLLGNNSFKDVIPWLGWMDRLKGLDGEIDRVFKGLDHILENVVQENQIKMNNKQKNIIHTKEDDHEMNFVEILLQAQKDNKVALQPHSIKAVIMDMFVGGTDTIYTLIEWTMIELIRHPKVMKQVQEEIRKLVVAGNGKKVSEDNLEKLTYLKAVVKETLRLHPPFPMIPRKLSKDVNINGYDIEAETHVIINVWAIHRDPLYWIEPEEFRPERFLNDTYDFKGQNFNYIPFGAGRKICPAISFGVVKAELAIATLVHDFDWKLPNGSAIDMTEIAGLAVQTRDPPMLIATPFISKS